MASEAVVNGTSTANDGLSPAQQLMQKHSDAESHKPTVEEVVDEEDIAHPPPSASTTSAAPTPQPELSEKAAGKQRAQDTENVPPKSKQSSGKAPLNTQSEEAFPSLAPPKPSSAPNAASTWGRKPASVKTNGVNGTNGTSVPSSRASTPASGMTTPATGGMRGGAAPSISLPGRYTESIRFVPSQLTPKRELKRPLKDILADISKRSKATVQVKEQGGFIVFEGQGPVEAVRQALKEVAKELGSKQSTKVAIPSSVRAHVIGRQGATIQGISKRTGARIQVPKQEDNAAEDDDSATIDVLIEGDAVSAEMARREIEAIVNERTSNVNMRLKDIPPELYPFLAGPYNKRANALEEGRDVRVQIPHYHTWTHQAPPQTSRGQPAPFVPHPNHHIQISGDRLAAQEARAQLESEVQQLMRSLTVDQMPIERGRHQFIVGERGNSLHDFMEETGCSIVMPPGHDDSEILYIVGPPDKIENGVNKVMDLASSMSMASVDVHRHFANAPMGAQAHAQNVARYLRQRQAVEELEKMHNASIVLPTTADGPSAWEIYAREGKNTMMARADLMKLLQGHPPSRFMPMEIDPFYHQHLQRRAAQQVRDDRGVHVVFPDEREDSPQVLLVFEGPTAPSEYQIPRGAPSNDEVQAFEAALQEAQQHILSLLSGQDVITSRDVEVHPKFHDKLRRHIEKEQASLSDDEFPVQVFYGEALQQGARQPAGNKVSMRGPSASVGGLAEKIAAFLEQAEKDELERGFTTSFDFPQRHANHLIGKRGENIKKLRDEFDVDIQVHDGKIDLKGPEAKCNAAKAHIISLGKKLEDEATHVVKIQPQYHRDMIGAKGSQVNRLQDRYSVRINFPRSTQAKDDDEDGSVRNARNQAPDEVIIRGPKRGADEARDELLSLLQYTMDNSHTANVSVAQSQLPSLIGQGGREMEALRMATGAQIDVPNSRDAADGSGRVELKLKGTKKQVDEAKKMLQERAKVFDSITSRTIDVDKKHHKALIGTGGANIRDIVVAAGGPDDRRELARMVRFPRQDSEENSIRVEGNDAIVNKIIDAIEKHVNERESQVVDVIDVAPEKHRLLIGRGGESRRNLESQFNIGLDIPKQTATGAARTQVKISGQPTDVEKAKGHILGMVKEQEGETINVPRRLHHIISDNGQFFRRLRNDHKVTVDHAGQQPPPRPSGPSQNRKTANGNSMPLITDDPSSAQDSYSWELIDGAEDAEGIEGDIPWILRGSPENVAKARQMLEKAMEQGAQPTSTGYLILPDPSAYRLVVGQGGSQINSIRRKTNTKVTVPRDQAKGEAIEIQGAKEGVEEARDIILELVKNSGRS